MCDPWGGVAGFLSQGRGEGMCTSRCGRLPWATHVGSGLGHYDSRIGAWLRANAFLAWGLGRGGVVSPTHQGAPAGHVRFLTSMRHVGCSTCAAQSSNWHWLRRVPLCTPWQPP